MLNREDEDAFAADRSYEDGRERRVTRQREDGRAMLHLYRSMVRDYRRLAKLLEAKGAAFKVSAARNRFFQETYTIKARAILAEMREGQ